MITNRSERERGFIHGAAARITIPLSICFAIATLPACEKSESPSSKETSERPQRDELADAPPEVWLDSLATRDRTTLEGEIATGEGDAAWKIDAPSGFQLERPGADGADVTIPSLPRARANEVIPFVRVEPAMKRELEALVSFLEDRGYGIVASEGEGKEGMVTARKGERYTTVIVLRSGRTGTVQCRAFVERAATPNELGFMQAVCGSLRVE